MEEKYYDFKEGGWYLLPFKKGIYKYILLECSHVIKGVWSISIILCTFSITLRIFRACIENNTLNEMIALGAVFATFGSAVISIFSLCCNEQINHFQNNLFILQNDLIKTGNWNRWRFLKKIQKRNWKFYEVKNPKLLFFKVTKEIAIPIPTDISDFKDISVVQCSFYLFILSQLYAFTPEQIITQKTTEFFLVIQCLKNIYINIIYYKISNFFIWTGCGFTFSSIIFSFFYPQINYLFTPLGL